MNNLSESEVSTFNSNIDISFKEINTNINKLKFIGELTNDSIDNKNINGLKKAQEFCQQIDKDITDEFERLVYNFNIANIYDGFSKFDSCSDKKKIIFNSHYDSKILYHLRSAYYSKILKKLPPKEGVFQFEILTNYANLLNKLGRPIEAIDVYTECLELNPDFAMAQANLAIALQAYGYLINNNHSFVFFAKCKELFETAIKGELTNEAFSDINNLLNSKFYQKQLSYKELLKDQITYSLGNSEPEITYRKWVIENKLFLHPLNDLFKFSVAAIDEFHLPSMLDKFEEQTQCGYYGFFNQIKQEFVSARFIYFNNSEINTTKPHFSDNGVLQFDASLDYPMLNYYTENLKYCYRALFSIFDKIAYFINSYLGLGVRENKVNFRNVWYLNGEIIKGINSKILESNNFVLRGIFGISKDILQSENSFTDSDAKIINTIRQHLEHKYLKIHRSFWKSDDSFFSDKMSYDINIDEFERICLKLLKYVRASLMYLSLMVGFEENKIDNLLKNGKIGKLELPLIEDASKFKF